MDHIPGERYNTTRVASQLNQWNIESLKKGRDAVMFVILM